MPRCRTLLLAAAAAALAAASAAAGVSAEDTMCCYLQEAADGSVTHTIRGTDSGCMSAEAVHCEVLARVAPRPANAVAEGGRLTATEADDEDERKAALRKAPVMHVFASSVTPMMCGRLAVTVNKLRRWPTDDGKPVGCVDKYGDAARSKTLAAVTCKASNPKPRHPDMTQRDAKGCRATADDAGAAAGDAKGAETAAAAAANGNGKDGAATDDKGAAAGDKKAAASDPAALKHTQELAAELAKQRKAAGGKGAAPAAHKGKDKGKGGEPLKPNTIAA